MTSMPQFWVFGYGSLMWRPGFDFIESQPALLRGFHRSLCVYSFVHRGTPDRPGLVLGLDRGGSCRGVAFRVAAHQWQETLAYLRGREQVTMVYREIEKPVLLRSSARPVQALTYVVVRGHRQYAGKLDEAALVFLIRQGEGVSGRCSDYLRNTLSHLRELGIRDARLEALAEEVGLQAVAATG